MLHLYSMNITVSIVEDNHDIRNALEQIIDMTEGFTLAGSCNNGEDALLKIPEYNPQVVLMDINLGGISGIEVVRQLKEKCPNMLFMMCTVYEEDEKIFEALSAGACGYILKKTTPAKLLDAVRELHQGGAPMSSQIARKVVDAFNLSKQSKTSIALSTEREPLEDLSKRENEILEMISRGLLIKEIAEQLFISPQTVKKHTFRIYEKLHVSNRIEAVNRYFGR